MTSRLTPSPLLVSQNAGHPIPQEHIAFVQRYASALYEVPEGVDKIHENPRHEHPPGVPKEFELVVADESPSLNSSGLGQCGCRCGVCKSWGVTHCCYNWGGTCNDGYLSHCTRWNNNYGSCVGQRNVWGQGFCQWTPAPPTRRRRERRRRDRRRRTPSPTTQSPTTSPTDSPSNSPTDSPTPAAGKWTITRTHSKWGGSREDVVCGESTDVLSIEARPSISCAEQHNGAAAWVVVNQQGKELTWGFYCDSQGNTEIVGTPTFAVDDTCLNSHNTIDDGY